MKLPMHNNLTSPIFSMQDLQAVNDNVSGLGQIHSVTGTGGNLCDDNFLDQQPGLPIPLEVNSSKWYHNSRAANSHALSVSLTHFTTFSRSHADMLISHANFFFFFFFLVRGLWCTKRRVPLLCACKIDAKSLSPPPPPRSSAFLGLARLYRLAADGPRISHSEPPSNVGSPVILFHWTGPFCQRGQEETPGLIMVTMFPSMIPATWSPYSLRVRSSKWCHSVILLDKSISRTG